ncbi:exported hypothetical protein [Candidatus Sulfotelmatomonas gaucii]|uniref:Uncharacterized protein n=1 Tax=Candidatus Sulfuritelmatomonas gaucii TaxID=2043161 RepID=A0A2N9LWP4_9BACT|nr:exported hypothetical protein [Candidatus Sulfotelmatomonas gaucii]
MPLRIAAGCCATPIRVLRPPLIPMAASAKAFPVTRSTRCPPSLPSATASRSTPRTATCLRGCVPYWHWSLWAFRSGAACDQNLNPKPGLKSSMTLNDLEFAYAPVRNQVRDLREYL